MKLKELKKGEWFTIRPLEYPAESQVYIKGDYDRELKKYECGRWHDISEAVYLKGEREVYTDFIF